MKDYKVSCRRATPHDDIAAIAKYLHLTDAYIYPVICSDPCAELWRNIVTDCYFAQNNIFSMENIVVAQMDDEIVGVLCVIACGQRKRFMEDVSKKWHCDGLHQANQGYFVPLIEESADMQGYNVTNVCVDAQMRGKGVGGALLQYCMDLYAGSVLHLDVIADNAPAIRLYEKMGFSVCAQYNGFSGTDEPLPCYHMEANFAQG